MSDLIAQAGFIARLAHAGQVDKAGEPYINHPLWVAAQMATELGKVVALLHDVVEDTRRSPIPITLDDLRLFFPEEAVEAVDAITRREGETDDQYYARVKAVPLAKRVKIRGDVKHNTLPERLARLNPKVAHRLTRKYTRTLGALGPDDGVAA